MRVKLIRETTRITEIDGQESGGARMEYFTLGNIYEVAVAYQVEEESYLLLIDDNGHLVNRTAYCFEIESNETPDDWKINILSDKMTIIIGPDF